MMDKTNKEELIEQYLLGELQGEALANFKNRLVADDAFRQEVAFEQAILKNLRTVGKNEWRLKLENYHQGMEEKNPGEEETNAIIRPIQNTAASKTNYYLAIAASIILVLVSIFVINYYVGSTDPTKVFQAYYQPYEGIENTVRSTPSGKTTLMEEAFQLYNRGSYQASIPIFQKVLAKEENETARFYLANAYLATNQVPEAIKGYTQYLKQYREFETEASWYLALSYLKAGNTEAAQPLLKKLATGNNDYSQQASGIIEKLK